VLVARMPASALTVDLSCGSLKARAVVPAGRGETRVLVALTTADRSTFGEYEASWIPPTSPRIRTLSPS
jgi:hypothetical protein